MSNHDPNMAHTDAAHSHDDPSVYLKTLILLLILTVITVGASYIDFGSGNTAIALFIATIKATLVALFFMHLAHDKPINAVIAISGFIFLGIFLMFDLIDFNARQPYIPFNYAPAAQAPMPGASPAGTEADEEKAKEKEKEKAAAAKQEEKKAEEKK
jgi:cytochrome c oxidase subunit 4